MCKWQRVIPRHKGSPRYQITHGWKNEFGSFKLETLKFLMHFREPGVHFILFLHILTFFSFSHTYIFFLFFFLLSFSSYFFICSPFNSKIAFYLPPPPCLDVVLGQRDDRDNVGIRNTFPLERYLKSSILAPSCDLPWIDDPYSMIGCGQGVSGIHPGYSCKEGRRQTPTRIPR
jgi:hypothetical protein